MKMRVQPVHLVGDAWHVFPQDNQKLGVTMSAQTTAAAVAALHAALRSAVTAPAAFLDPVVVGNDLSRERFAELSRDADVVILNTSCTIDPEVLAVGRPVIVFAGERTPMMALYSLPVGVRRNYPDLHFALDYADVNALLARLGMQQVVARLRRSRMLILGEYRCFERLPEPGRLLDRLGIELQVLAGAGFLALAEQADEQRVNEVCARWRDDALAVDEPDAEDLRSAARLFVTLHDYVQANRFDAISVGCLEIMYQHQRRPFCFVLATLRDMGLPAGCESDATATITMLILECIAERPAYMGNLVLADPRQNLVAISHGCSPRYMYGRDAAPLPYRLVHSHSVPPFTHGPEGGSGLTSYVDYGQRGQPVTICRISAQLDEFFVASGEIVDCRDTICDRTTLTVRVSDARAYAHQATGNHQVLVYGDYVEQIESFCALTGMRTIGPRAPRPDAAQVARGRSAAAS